MAVVSESTKRIEVSEPKDPSPSGLAADAASESSLIARSSFSADTPDRNDSSNSSPNPYKDAEAQSPALLRSEEYRQLFRLPPDDVLVEDFNCALQENILIQGHMYLFVHHICFYSNIFGFETKKIIPFHEVTGVRRAKTAGIFPNAIEIVTGGKKHFFASFLSRDEAFKIINDGWLNHSNGANGATEQQESASESSSQENGGVLIERVKCFESPAHESDSLDRNKDPPVLNDSLPINVEDETVTATATASEQQDNVGDAVPVLNAEPSSSIQTLIWKHENIAAPKIPEFYTKVAESKIPIKVEDFFSFFFTDDAFSFTESFHKRCGDKEFRSSSWYPHDKYGHARDVSFQHPIKIYFGAKFGSCQEIQKFRVYRNREGVKIEHEKKLSTLQSQEYKGEDEIKLDKTKTSIKRLQSLIIVSSQAVSTTSTAIIGLRDSDLVPQLVELCHG